MKCYALLAASLALAAASPTGVKFVDDDGNVEFITFGNGVLTVPQHCRDNTCNTLTAYAKAQTTFAQAQASENAALRGLITSLRTDLVALSKKHGDDIAVVSGTPRAPSPPPAATTATRTRCARCTSRSRSTASSST